MSTPFTSAKLPREIRAEAAAWLAHLNGPESTTESRESFRRWIAASPLHAAAFRKADRVWKDAATITAATVLRDKPVRRRPFSERFIGQPFAMAAASLVVVTVATVVWSMSGETIKTRVGEQRMVTLRDGSRVVLNTNTTIVAEPWRRMRELRLDKGEAYFEIAKDPNHPFVIAVGDRKVVALGTSFVVEREAEASHEKLAVTLIQGRVAVTNVDAPQQTAMTGTDHGAILSPGQRLVIAGSATSIDRPNLEAITAWRSGKVVLQETPLKDAVRDFNRYNPVPLILKEEAAASLPISGIFRIGDSEEFANAVANLYGLTVVKEPKRLLLVGTTRPNLR